MNLNHIPGCEYGGARLELEKKEQYAQRIILASDQYGTVNSISYTAVHMAGPPVAGVPYDELVDSYMLTTHGNWLREVPSYMPEYGLANVPESLQMIGHDFIVVSFEHAVVPDWIRIYEAFNPGAVKRVWAHILSVIPHWELLWEQTNGYHFNLTDPTNDRGINLYVNNISYETRVLWIEFDTRFSLYMPSYDGIVMYGPPFPKCRCPKSRPRVSSPEDPSINQATPYKAGKHHIIDLPDEMLLNIFSKLDLQTLMSAEQVCRKFQAIARDKFLYREINLRPYWMIADSKMLQWLQNRCTNIKKLDLSWCGMFQPSFLHSMERFLHACGETIIDFRLDNVGFTVNQSIMRNITRYCPSLEVVSIKQMPCDFMINSLPFSNLKRLNLSRTAVNTDNVIIILQRSPKIEHLDLSCCHVIEPQEIVQTIAKHNREIISLNFWKAGALLPSGLRALKECTKLRELDIGWTITQDDLDQALGDMLHHCPNMFKLGLASTRNLQNADLEDIAKYCRNLVQLDIMGCISVTEPFVERILRACTKLQYIDLFHCEGIDDSQIMDWESIFPRVTFKHYTSIINSQR